MEVISATESLGECLCDGVARDLCVGRVKVNRPPQPSAVFLVHLLESHRIRSHHGIPHVYMTGRSRSPFFNTLARPHSKWRAPTSATSFELSAHQPASTIRVICPPALGPRVWHALADVRYVGLDLQATRPDVHP